MSIGEKIKKYRKDKKISQRELAKVSKVSFAYIQQLEKGIKDNPSIEILNKIATALEITINDLVGYKKTVTQEILENLISRGISLEKISEESNLSIDQLEAMYNNNDSLIQPGSLKKLAEYLHTDKETMTTWFLNHVFTNAIYNNDGKDPNLNSLKRFLMNEPFTLEDILLDVKDENERQVLTNLYYAGVLNRTDRSKNNFNLNTNSSTKTPELDMPNSDVYLINYLAENKYPIDKLNNATLNHIDQSIKNLLDFEFFKLEKNNYKIEEPKND